MRTTLSIDDDVLAAARGLAAREHKPIGEVISALARQALQRPAATASSRNGVPLLPSQPGAMPAAPPTLALVNQLRDELP